MDGNNKFESVYSTKVRAGKRRTYFFDVRKTKGEDFYVTITESTKRFNGDGYDRHKIFLYKEDFNRFVDGMTDAVNHVKTELMPDYDYEEYERRQQEWDQKMKDEAAAAANAPAEDTDAPQTIETPEVTETPVATETPEATPTTETTDDDMSW